MYVYMVVCIYVCMVLLIRTFTKKKHTAHDRVYMYAYLYVYMRMYIYAYVCIYGP